MNTEKDLKLLLEDKSLKNALQSVYSIVLSNILFLFEDFSNFLLLPKYYLGNSRKEIAVEESLVDIRGDEFFVFPVFPAAMKFFGKKFVQSLKEIYEKENIKVLHFYPRVGISKEELEEVLDLDHDISVSLGTNLSNIELALSRKNVKILSLDIAHGASLPGLKAIEDIKNIYGIKNGIVWGNFGSLEGIIFALFVLTKNDFGNFYLKLGIGSGSACTTRTQTGSGLPNIALITLANFLLYREQDISLSSFISNKTLKDEWFSLLDLREKIKNILSFWGLDLIALGKRVKFILDGGFRNNGDLAKALSLSDFVMSGKLFISEEMEGDKYYGMASSLAKALEGKEGYVEGEVYKADKKESLKTVLLQMKHAIQSSLSYSNAKNLADFRKNKTLIINHTKEGFQK